MENFGKMKKKIDLAADELHKKLTRIALIEKMDLQTAKIYKRNHNKLRRLLLRYDAKILNHEFVSITLKNYDDLMQYDSEAVVLISDLNYKIQFKML